jgi:hypothetical protein
MLLLVMSLYMSIIIRGVAFQLEDTPDWSSFASLCLPTIRLICGSMVFHSPQVG